MSSILITILPVFGLIALGFISARTRFIGSAPPGLSQFVFNLAMPALLFRTMLLLDQQSFDSFLCGSPVRRHCHRLDRRLICAHADLEWRRRRFRCDGRNIRQCRNAGFAADARSFRRGGALPVCFIVSVHAPVLWLAAVIHIETARQGHTPAPFHLPGSWAANWPAIRSCWRWSGSLWRATGLGLDPMLDRISELLGEAGIPAALVALGLSLAGYSLKGQWRGILTLMALKMVLLPLMVWLIAP